MLKALPRRYPLGRRVASPKMGVLAIVLLLLAHNNLLNLWPPFNGWLYVPINLMLTALLVVVGIAGFGLSTHALGLAAPVAKPVLIGLALAVVATSPLFAMTLNRRTAQRIADRRVRHLQGAGALYQILVRIPLGTALLEEVAFRGLLFAALRHTGDVQAAAMSSVVFGLWHVGPTVNLVKANRPGSKGSFMVCAVALAVVGTTLAGLGFTWLRIELDSLWGPWALHAALNALGTAAALLAHRRLRADVEA